MSKASRAETTPAGSFRSRLPVVERRHREAAQTFAVLSAGVVLVLGLAGLATGADLISHTDQKIVWIMIINVIAVLGLQIYAGNAGKMTISHAAFMAMGAYGSAIFTINPVLKKSVLNGLPDWLYGVQLDTGWAMLLVVFIVMLVGALIGFVIVRLHYDGVVISTFALLLIVQSMIFAAKGWTNGATSIYGMPVLKSPDLIGAVAIVAIAIATFFKNSRAGLQLRAARDDEESAQAMGVDSRRLNHIAWVLSVGLAAAAGALLVHVLGATSPRNFYFVMTIELIAMLTLGGQRSVTGAVIGAVFVSGIIFFMRKAESGFDLGSVAIPPLFGATQLALAAAILLVLYLRPQGLMGSTEVQIPGRAPKPAAPAPTQPFKLRDKGPLKLEGLGKRFGGLQALQGASFEVRAGRIVGLIGPNGAGKSTLINTVMGRYYPSAGRILINGSDGTSWPAHRLAREGIGRTFQQIRLATHLSVVENVMVPMSVTYRRDQVLEANALGLLDRLGILHLATLTPDALSYGDRRRVEIARALALRPTWLLLDEPAAGMNHEETEALRDLLAEIRDAFCIGILIVEHDLPLIMSLCDSVVVLNRGQQIALGNVHDIQSDPAVIEAYVGSDDGTAPAPRPPRPAPLPGAEPILSVRDLSVRYGAVAAVKNASLEVYEGEIVALLGVNGAGKSSLLNAVVGLAPVHGGRVTFAGRDITGGSVEDIVRAGVSLTPEGRQVFADLTVRENLRLGAATLGDGRAEEVLNDLLARFPILAERADQAAGTMSGGEQQMLAIARSLMSRPRLLILDEPSLGLAPVIVGEVFKLISDLRDSGTTVLLVEQNVGQSLAIADRAYLLELGDIAQSGAAQDFLDTIDLKKIYLGG